MEVAAGGAGAVEAPGAGCVAVLLREGGSGAVFTPGMGWAPVFAGGVAWAVPGPGTGCVAVLPGVVACAVSGPGTGCVLVVACGVAYAVVGPGTGWLLVLPGAVWAKAPPLARRPATSAVMLCFRIVFLRLTREKKQRGRHAGVAPRARSARRGRQHLGHHRALPV